MSIKKVSKKTTKIAAATGMTIFSLLCVFVATYAWFSMNANTGASGMNVKIANLSGRLQYVYFHAFDEQNSSESTFKFNKTAFATYEYDWDNKEIDIIDDEYATWKMGDYTYIDKNHPMLIIFAFDQEYTSSLEGDFYIKGITTVGGNSLVTTYSDQGEPLETTGGGFLGARVITGQDTGTPFYTLPQSQVNDESHPESILMKRERATDEQGNPALDNQGNPLYNDYYALSSVAAFHHKTFTTSGYNSLIAGSTLDFAVSSLDSTESFTTIKNDTDKYVFNQTPYLYKSDGHSTIKYVALIIDYSPEAIGYIYSTYLGDAGLNNYDSILHFACDWRFEVC